MSNDLISRSALLEEYCRQNECLQNHSGDCRNCFGSYVIKTAPAVDAVIPVRCAQCNHFKRNLENDTYCSSVNGLTDPQEDDFCSYGERKDGDK